MSCHFISGSQLLSTCVSKMSLYLMHGALKKLTYESGLASRRLGYCMRLSRMSDGDRPLNDDGDDAHS